MKNNLEYLKTSINSKEKPDIRYMALEYHKEIDDMIIANEKINQLMLTIKKSKEKNTPCFESYEKLYKLVLDGYGSKNALNSFINACDSTVATVKENPESFKQIVDLYLEYRGIPAQISKEFIQATVDKGAQRSLGKTGENKVIKIAENSGFKHAKTISEFFQNDFSITNYTESIKDIINKDLNFGSQNKKLDIIFKIRDSYAFLEAKHIKESGGAQDKQIKELIGLLNIDAGPNNYMISFMDGVYSNKLLKLNDNHIDNPKTLLTGKIKNKINRQQYEILTELKNNKKSFWVNTAGLKSLIDDFIKTTNNVN